MRVLDTMKKIPSKLKVLRDVLTFSKPRGLSESEKEDDREHTKIFDNKPTAGIVLKELGLYWPVSSLIVEDPRGFRAYINIETIIDLLNSASINKGIIVDECIYYHDNGKTFLISTESDEYKQLVELTNKRNSDEAITSSKLEVGGVYRHRLEGDIVYLGKYSLYDVGYSWVERDADGTIRPRMDLEPPYELGDYTLYQTLVSRNLEISYYNGEYKKHPEFIAERQRVMDKMECVPFKVYSGTYFVFAYIPKYFEENNNPETYIRRSVSLIYRRRIDKDMFVSKVGERKEAAKRVIDMFKTLEIVNPDVTYKEDKDVVSDFFSIEDPVSAYRRHMRSMDKIDKLKELGNIDVL